MSRTISTGVFIPVGNHGWIHSVNSPPVEDGSFRRVLEVTRTAEDLGFDFVLSPAIWRGRKGPSRHWMDSLESFTTTAALLQGTSRIAVFGTVHMTVYPPAIIAKMLTTLDQIGPGRVGINLVTGSSYLDLAHVGLWRDGLDHDERYDLGDEWIKIAKRLWTEDVVTHKGKFFELNEATMGPKPSRLPQLVNAGASGRGLQFAAENTDIAFLAGGGTDKGIETYKQARATARQHGKPNFKIFAGVSIICAESDEEAQARLKYFDDGVDIACLEDIALGYSMNPDVKKVSGTVWTDHEKSSVAMGTLVGSYDTVAKRLAKMVLEGELDGIMLTVPDFVDDLKKVSGEVFTRMEHYGVICGSNGA